MLTKFNKFTSLQRFINIHHRSYAARISTEELDEEVKETKPAAKKPRKKSTTSETSSDGKMAKEMRQHFSNVQKKFVLLSHPEHLVKKKTKLPTGLYLTCPNIAREIVDEVKKDLPEHRPILEANPGSGTITKLLLKETKNEMFLYEPEAFFHDSLKELAPNATLCKKDLLSLSSFALADYFDDGNRVSELFRGIAKKEFNDEPAGRVILHTCSWVFIKQILRSVMFQNNIAASGRFEFYACMPPLLWMQLTCSGSAGYFLYRESSVLFQLFFDYQLIRKFDKREFLPWLGFKVGNKKEKFLKIDSDSMYFAKFVPRDNLHKICRPENLTALWYFVSQNMTKRAHRVIPQLEQWIPGCGPRLIINSHTGVQAKPLHEQTSDIKPSMYRESCRELIKNETIDNLSIFTEFGELSPLQIYHIFEQFINFPEFKESPFNALMETAMLKLQHSTEETDLLLEEGDETKQEESKSEQDQV